MNDTTVIGSAEVEEDVRAYVLAVRAWLGDLPADEVEDLTAGMEADLAERAAESGGPLGGLLGQPEAYAAELRSAAGLPSRVEVVVPDAVPSEPWTQRLVRDAHQLVGRHPWLRELRPTWWLARGAVAGWVLAAVLGTGRTVLLPLVGAALSMWLGLVLRRREPLGTGVRVALAAGNALAVVLLLPMLASYTSGPSGFSDEVAVTQPGLSGLVSNGEPVSNVYAYDAAGNRVPDVRLFDQFGQPVQLSPDAVPIPVGPQGEDVVAWPPEQRALSVFPLRLVPGADPWTSSTGQWSPPALMVPLAGSAASSEAATPGASTGPTVAPSGSPSPAPSASSTP
jgi:hypothetical protein